jgi:hypothetical protein
MDEQRGKERRRDERRRLKGAATLFWRTAGYEENSCVGNAFDVSATGLLVEVPECILVGTRTSVQINGSGQRMEATVRHCRKHGTWYRIGLQFKAKPLKAEQGSARNAA